MAKPKVDISYYLKYEETFAILRKSLEKIIRSGSQPKDDELAAYIGAETRPLSNSMKKYIASRFASPKKTRGRPKTLSVGDHTLQNWCCKIYDDVHLDDIARGTPDPSSATRERIAKSLHVSPATIGRWAKKRKTNIKK